MANTIRTKQCAKCPWRVDVDPNDIPNGYCSIKHAALKSAIVDPEVVQLGGSISMMACHEHPVGGEVPCVGWLHNQLGTGNNIALRLWFLRQGIKGRLHVVGEQHERFEETLPDREEP